MSREKQIIEEMAKVLCEDCARDVAPCSLNNLGRMCDSVREQAEALYEAGYRKQEWISVEERLPEDGETVLTIDSDGEMQVSFYETYLKGIFQQFHGLVMVHNITHWMPLPEPPKKGGAE